MLHRSLRWSVGALLSAWTTVPAQVAVTTQHNDLNRTGANLEEAILNTSNVNVNTFGKLFSITVDGQIYAQPLYVSQVSVPGQGVHNIIFVSTQHNSVYAFDADSVTGSAPLWHVNFGPTGPGITNTIEPEVGITSTPVIDLSSNTLYVVSQTSSAGVLTFQIHALDITSGTERSYSPAAIQGSLPGHSVDSKQGILSFNPSLHWQRAGLLLLNGTLFIGFGSHGDDTEPFHGWLFAYSAATLHQTSVVCLSPNGLGAGIWAGGKGLSADGAGNIYLQTGNGTMDANSGGPDYGDSIVKLGNARGLAVVDYFSPSNQSTLNSDDADLGSSGPTLIPGTSLGVAGGKDGRLFVFNTGNLGQYNASDHIVQEWQATFNEITGSGGIFGSDIVYYNSRLYLWGRNDALKAFAFNGATFDTVPVSQTTFRIADGYSNEPSLSISANGTVGGTGIIWAAYSTTGPATGLAYPGILRAFDASDLTHELWNSNQNSARDYSGSWAKWSPPTVANGKVYLATFDNTLNVYGILPKAGSGGSLSASSDSSITGANLTVEGTADWVHWGDGSLNRKAGLAAQISNYTEVGVGIVYAYSPDLRPLSWTDGTPTGTSTNNTDGLYINAVGNGFLLTAPADTGVRTLTVHVGGWNSGGTLQGHLSDGSAPDFMDTTADTAGQWDRNYTLTYHAGAAQQTLTVSWTMTSGTGNVTLSGAALSNAGTSITATAGTPQSASVNTAFATALQATVRTASGAPSSGVSVTFMAPTSGASGSFKGSATASVVTNSSGVATAPTFTANGQTGNYTVNATVSGIGTSASFSLTNTAAVVGTLTGSGNSLTTGANLTVEGTADWVHWGDGSLNRKAGVAAQISNYTEVGVGIVYAYSPDLRPLSWTDGTPTGTSTNNTDGLYINAVGNGFLLTAPADTGVRTLTVHVGGWNSGGTLQGHLSDGSAPDFMDTTADTAGQWDRNYTLTYHAGAAQQTLTVSWTMTSGTGNVTLSGAALK